MSKYFLNKDSAIYKKTLEVFEKYDPNIVMYNDGYQCDEDEYDYVIVDILNRYCNGLIGLVHEKEDLMKGLMESYNFWYGSDTDNVEKRLLTNISQELYDIFLEFNNNETYRSTQNKAEDNNKYLCENCGEETTEFVVENFDHLTQHWCPFCECIVDYTCDEQFECDYCKFKDECSKFEGILTTNELYSDEHFWDGRD